GDVHEDAVAHARARREVLRRVGRDVVAARRRARAVAARVAAVREEDGRRDESGRRRVVERDLHDRDEVVRRLAVGEGRVRAVRRHVDEQLLAVLRRRERVRVRAALRLDRRHVLRRRRLGDVEDLDALPRLLDRRALGDVVARVVAARRVGAEDQEVPVDGDVVLRARADDLGDLLRGGRVRDVVHREPAVVAGEGVAALEREVAAVLALGGELAVLRDVGDVGEVRAARDLAGRQDVGGLGERGEALGGEVRERTGGLLGERGHRLGRAVGRLGGRRRGERERTGGEGDGHGRGEQDPASLPV